MICADLSIKDDHIVAICHGVMEVNSFWETLNTFRALMEETNLYHLLIDWRDVEPARNDFDRYLAGKAMAETLGSPCRVGVYCLPSQLRNYIIHVARNRGVDIYLSEDFDKAANWLHEEQYLSESS